MKICYDCRDKSTIHLMHRGFFIINFTGIKCCIFKKPDIESRVASDFVHFEHLCSQKDTAKSLENAFERFFKCCSITLLVCVWVFCLFWAFLFDFFFFWFGLGIFFLLRVACVYFGVKEFWKCISDIYLICMKIVFTTVASQLLYIY